jgi:hypothetical protein
MEIVPHAKLRHLRCAQVRHGVSNVVLWMRRMHIFLSFIAVALTGAITMLHHDFQLSVSTRLLVAGSLGVVTTTIQILLPLLRMDALAESFSQHYAQVVSHVDARIDMPKHMLDELTTHDLQCFANPVLLAPCLDDAL